MATIPNAALPGKPKSGRGLPSPVKDISLQRLTLQHGQGIRNEPSTVLNYRSRLVL